jgi:hypothetical protein
MYNILTGDGFSKSLMGGWSIALLGVAVLFFLIVFINKIAEDYDLPWNRLFAWVGGAIGYLLLITLTGQARWGLVAGLGGISLGYFSGLFWGESI